VNKRRKLTESDLKPLIDAVLTCRAACVTVLLAAPVQGDVYLATEDVLRALDEATDVLSGRTPHSSPHA